MESASTTSSGSVRSGPALQHPGVILIFAIISDDFVNLDIFDRALLTKEAEMHTVKKFKVLLDVITLTTEEYQDQKSLIAGYASERNHITDGILSVRMKTLKHEYPL